MLVSLLQYNRLSIVVDKLFYCEFVENTKFLKSVSFIASCVMSISFVFMKLFLFSCQLIKYVEYLVFVGN